MEPVTMTAALAGVGAGVAVLDHTQRVMATAIKNLYGVAKTLEEFFDDHIEMMKSSDDNTVSRTGSGAEGSELEFAVDKCITPHIEEAGHGKTTPYRLSWSFLPCYLSR